MSTIASRDLRNHTRSVLDRVAAGDTVQVTVSGRVVAQIGPPTGLLRAHLTKAEVTAIVTRTVSTGSQGSATDTTLLDDLAWIGAGSTDDLGDLG